MHEREKPWKPLDVDEVSQLFADAPFFWCIAGGIALELAIGKTIRAHSDIDVLVLRQDHLLARNFLREWDCWAADPPGTLRPWQVGKELAATVHDVWCRESASSDWQLQLMIDESDRSHWVSRRNDQVRLPIAQITQSTANGVRYLAPSIQLFYKAKEVREKDTLDFDAVTKSGIDFDSAWLQDAIVRCYGEQHPWLERLRA